MPGVSLGLCSAHSQCRVEGARYRRGKCTYEKPVGHGQEERGLESSPNTTMIARCPLWSHRARVFACSIAIWDDRGARQEAMAQAPMARPETATRKWEGGGRRNSQRCVHTSPVQARSPRTQHWCALTRNRPRSAGARAGSENADQPTDGRRQARCNACSASITDRGDDPAE